LGRKSGGKGASSGVPNSFGLGFSLTVFSGVVIGSGGRGASSTTVGPGFLAPGTLRKSGGRGASSAALGAAFCLGVVRKSGGSGASSALVGDCCSGSVAVPADEDESPSG
jgi:hypothetical protein